MAGTASDCVKAPRFLNRELYRKTLHRSPWKNIPHQLWCFSFNVLFIASKRGGKNVHFKAYKLLILCAVPSSRLQPVSGMTGFFFFLSWRQEWVYVWILHPHLCIHSANPNGLKVHRRRSDCRWALVGQSDPLLIFPKRLLSPGLYSLVRSQAQVFSTPNVKERGFCFQVACVLGDKRGRRVTAPSATIFAQLGLQNISVGWPKGQEGTFPG